jgi:hypothetical protein
VDFVRGGGRGSRPFSYLSSVTEYAPGVERGHRSVVSLHSHTIQSKETLRFLPSWADGIPVVGWLVRREMKRHVRRKGCQPDFLHSYWTPPFTPREVLESERAQIASRFAVPALVSITDHDTIGAGFQLRALGLGDEAPVSVEWTVVFRGTRFHLGIHNLPPDLAATMMAAFDEHRGNPVEARLGELLAWVHEQANTLTVLNHPLWDAFWNADQDTSALDAFMEAYCPFLDAVELNGYREWEENRAVVALATRWRTPLVAGGDRHGRAPNSMLNLSSAATFAEFVDEVRNGRRSLTVVLPEYRECWLNRLLETASDVLREAAPDEAGQLPWMDRVWVAHGDGRMEPISVPWGGGRCPWWVRASVKTACVLGGRTVRRALHVALVTGRGRIADTDRLEAAGGPPLAPPITTDD